MPERPICFVVSPIGKEGTEIRKRSDKILRHVIGPVADACGFVALRADQISEAGMITTQVINHIVEDAIVIADLTGSNANVFYELAVRHATRKPYVQIIQKGEPIPFDVAGLRTIELDLTDLDSVAAAKDEIQKQITSMQGAAKTVESPISVALDFEKLHSSNDPEKRQIADILQGLSDLKNLIEKRTLVISDTVPPLDRSKENRYKRAQELLAKFDKLVSDSGGITGGDKAREVLAKFDKLVSDSGGTTGDDKARELLAKFEKLRSDVGITGGDIRF